MTRCALRSRVPLRALACLVLAAVALAQSTPVVGQTASKPAGVAPIVTRAPELIEFIEAPYPEAELETGLGAEVVLSLAISESGEVLEVQVVQTAGPHFDGAALDAARQFRFQPAEIDGKPAPVRIAYRYTFAPPAPEITAGALRGVVADRKTGAPLSGVTIAIEGAGAVQTDAQGVFEVPELPAGTAVVTLSRADLTPLSTEELIEAGRTLEVRYDVELPEEASDDDADGDDLEIIVRAPPALVRQVVSTQVSSEEASRVPGTQGDVLKVVENLPGIARAAAGSGAVVVWGAAPEDTRTYVGAVRVPMLYHFGGLRSVLHNDRVASVELVPGGYGAAYGRGLGGLVLVERKALPSDRLRGSAQIDVLDASLAVATPLDDRISFGVAGRRSHIDQLGGLLADQSFQNYFTLPQYYDGQAGLSYALSSTESLQLSGLISGDDQRRSQPSDNPALRATDRRHLSFQRIDLEYRSDAADGSSVRVTPWYGHDFAERVTTFGGVPASAQTESNLFGLRAEWRGHLASALSATLGFDFEMVSSRSERSGSVTFPPREGDPFVFGRAPTDQLNYDAWDTTVATAAVYGEFDWTPLGDSFHIVPGMRVEPYLIEAERRRPASPVRPDTKAFSQDVAPEPRLSLRYSPFTDFTLRAAGGLYRQAPLPDDLSAVFGNPLLSVSHGQHVLAGVAYRFWGSLGVEASAFHTRSQELIARNPESNPRIAEAVVQTGEGRTIGAQLLLRKDKADSAYFGWVAYTIMRSERTSSSDDAYRLFDFDQTHVLTAVGAWDLGAGFEVGLRARVATGFPRTPVVDAAFDTRTGRYEPQLGALNTIRIPMFWQLDARASKRFDIADTKLEVYLDVQNVTNRENAEELAYAPDYSAERYVLGLPLLPVLGVRWEL